MISRFHVKNYRSIVDLDLSFTYDEGKAPRGFKDMTTWPFLEDKTGRYVPCLAIYGANASGKTNIIKALATFKEIVNKGIKKQHNPNKLHPDLSDTLFEIEYTLENSCFTYAITYNADTITHERLSMDGVPIYTITSCKPDFTLIAKVEEYTSERLQNIYAVECCSTINTPIQHTSFLNKISSNYSGLSHSLTYLYHILDSMWIISADNDLHPVFGTEIISIIDDSDNTYKKQFLKLIQALDIGIERIEYTRLTGHPKEESNLHNSVDDVDSQEIDILKADEIYTYHKDNQDNEVKFSISEESQGTRILFGLLGFILSSLKSGRPLIIDELDRSLHPLIVQAIVQLFKDKDYNKKNAQLIFTTHTTDLLEDNLLRVSEVAIINKTAKDGTTIRRLSEYKDIRNVTNFRKRYLEGAFRGIPYPYI